MYGYHPSRQSLQTDDIEREWKMLAASGEGLTN